MAVFDDALALAQKAWDAVRVARSVADRALSLALAYALPAGIPQEAWIAPTLLNSWVNFGAGGQPAGYCKDSQGFVRLKGMVKSGTPGATSVIFTLPAGYRPANNSHHGTVSNALFGFCRVDSNGDVIAYAGSGTWFSLDGINFDTR